MQQPSMRVKRKLRIVPTNTTSPSKLLPSIIEARLTHAFGKPMGKKDPIKDIIQYETLNDLLRQKLRDHFASPFAVPISKGNALSATQKFSVNTPIKSL